MIPKTQKNNIMCNKCNQNFTSMLDLQHHICIADQLKKQIKWNNPRSNTRGRSKVNLYLKYSGETIKHKNIIKLRKLEENENKT